MHPEDISPVVLLPGFHPPEWTAQFVAAVWGDRPPPLAIFPAHRQPVYAPDCVMAWLREQFADDDRPITLIGFSAGAVGAWALMRQWESVTQVPAAGRSLTLSRTMLIDGWGVPIATQIPCYRLSHDRFTHHTSALLGAGVQGFYADPPVAHGDLWRSPDRAWGWVAGRSGDRISAAAYIRELGRGNWDAGIGTQA